MSHLTILRAYAQKRNLSNLPDSVLFKHTERTVTIFDAFPKAIFHFLILPRVQPSSPDEPTVFDLASLKSLLKHKEKARKIVTELAEEAEEVKKAIETEMLARWGFKWEIYMGFHPVPSMTHLHLHVISSDLYSERLKTKKHFNSFHPKLGFFLHLTEVMEWLDAEPSYYNTMAKLESSKYEPLLKEPMACWKCDTRLKNIPTALAHIKAEWESVIRREKLKAAKKRKSDANDTKPIKHPRLDSAPEGT